jgi:DNA-binding MarR family transcriptional regulator
MSVKSVKSTKILYSLLISLVIVGIIIFINILSFSSIENILVNQLKEKQLTETESATSQIESHIIQVKDELITLSKFPLMETLDINECSGNMKVIHEKIEGKIDSLLRVDKEGNVIECSSPQFSDYVGLNIKNKEYFKVPKEDNEPFITGLVRQGTRQQVIISVPLFETSEYTPYPNFIGEFSGVLMSIIELNQLYYSYIHSYVQNDRNYFLLINLDTEETLLKSEGFNDYSEIKDYMPELSDGSAEITDFMNLGSTIITSSDLIFGSETWRLIILTPIENIEPDINSVQNRHIFSLGFVILVIITIFFFIISLYKSQIDTQKKLEKANVTLKNLGIKIEFEKDKFTKADINLETKKLYLIKEDDENHAYELFISSLNKGFAGLGIAREDPRKIKKKYNLQKTSFVWLSKNKVEDVPYETEIDALYTLIAEFIRKSKKSVILIDRLDYIISENKFEKVIKKIHALKDLVSVQECIIILSVNPELLEETQLRAIETETIDLYGKHLRKKVELSDIEMNILQYINNKNISNKLASYKDVTDTFKITKPTTRVKVDKLQKLGLLDVEQKGRFKSIKITSAGRRIIG